MLSTSQRVEERKPEAQRGLHTKDEKQEKQRASEKEKNRGFPRMQKKNQNIRHSRSRRRK
jgi:hypothetical protein